MTHVINYDFPLNPSDYIHRAGRVGRVGGAKVKDINFSRVSGEGEGRGSSLDSALGFSLSTESYCLSRGAG